MRNIIIAITVTLGTHRAIAQEFAPWEARGVSRETNVGASATSAPVGFAPWRDRRVVKDTGASVATRMSDAFSSVFRPWS